jgi:hypothetical protein
VQTRAISCPLFRAPPPPHLDAGSAKCASKHKNSQPWRNKF